MINYFRKTSFLFLTTVMGISIFSSGCNKKSGIDKNTLIHPLCYQSYCPTGAAKNSFIINHKIYLLSSNRTTKFADWVAYIVDKNNLHGPTRGRKWQQDPDIPAAYTLSPRDYKGANKACGYDRGHQAPLASFSNNPSWEKANYLSNITPQKSALNQGPWVRLESAVRHLALKGKPVYVVTGPIYEHKMCALPEQPALRIPSAYFKVIFLPNKEGVSYAAFVMPQGTTRKASMCQYAVDLNKVTKITGFQFLQASTKKNEDLLKVMGC